MLVNVDRVGIPAIHRNRPSSAQMDRHAQTNPQQERRAEYAPMRLPPAQERDQEQHENRRHIREKPGTIAMPRPPVRYVCPDDQPVRERQHSEPRRNRRTPFSADHAPYREQKYRRVNEQPARRRKEDAEKVISPSRPVLRPESPRSLR